MVVQKRIDAAILEAKMANLKVPQGGKIYYPMGT